MKLDLDFVCQSTGGRMLTGKGQTVISGVATDSRNIIPETLFFALKGELYDGHDYVREALIKGVSGAVISRLPDADLTLPETQAIIMVEDTLKALQDLAAAYRSQFDLPVVAVTGSVGKTTTRDLITCCLGSHFETLKTEGNFNNEIGLPLTLLRLEKGHQAAVLEMAMRAKGEIRRLAEIARPTAAVITNVEPVHLETLKTLSNIAQAKCEILSTLESNQLAVINGDNQVLMDVARNYPCRKYTFGYNEDCDFQINAVEVEKGGIRIAARLMETKEVFFLPLPSPRLAANVISAVAIANLMGVEIPEIKSSLQDFIPTGNRLKIITLKEGGKVIDDTYNANPVSMANALETGQYLKQGGKWIAILGDMLELGDYEIEGHKKVGEKAFNTGVDQLIAIGERAGYIAEGALEAGMPAEKIHYFKNKADSIPFLLDNLKKNDTVLFKASRGMRLETVMEQWLNHHNP